MAVGIPFVASPVGAVAEIGEAGITHLHAITNDDWFRGLELLLVDMKRRQSMGQAGRRHVVENYSLADQADKLAGALKEAAGTGRAG